MCFRTVLFSSTPSTMPWRAVLCLQCLLYYARLARHVSDKLSERRAVEATALAPELLARTSFKASPCLGAQGGGRGRERRGGEGRGGRENGGGGSTLYDE